jgi:hypothetical protein
VDLQAILGHRSFSFIIDKLRFSADKTERTESQVSILSLSDSNNHPFQVLQEKMARSTHLFRDRKEVRFEE